MAEITNPTVQIGQLNLSVAASRIVAGSTSFAVRNNANSADNLLISDAGAGTFRAGLTASSTITTNGGDIVLTRAAGTDRQVIWQTGGVARWVWRTNTVAESGSDAGSNLILDRYGDAGAFLGSPISITRASGLVVFANAATVTGALTANGGLTATTVVATSNVNAGAGSNLGFTGRSILTSGADGNIALSNNAGSSFSYLQFGGTSASFPALKRNTNSLECWLADGSAYASFLAANLYVTNTAFMVRVTGGVWSNGVGAATGTLTNAPTAGNPTKWIPIDDNGTTRHIPAW